MSRSGYVDNCDEPWRLEFYRQAVERAIKGKRGQAFLRELIQALDAMPEKRLIDGALIDTHGEVCALGAVCKSRQLDVTDLDPEDPGAVAKVVGIAQAMAAEIAYLNDEVNDYATPEQRWINMRRWAVRQLRVAHDSPKLPRAESCNG